MADFRPGLGLDIGTSTIVCARLDEDSITSTKLHRDAFFEIEPISEMNAKMIKKGLDERGVDYIIKGNSIYVIGAQAIKIANERHKEARRPLHRGVISAKEKEALPMIKHIIEALIGPPLIDNEPCYYSIPGQPVDSDKLNVEYHKEIFSRFLSGLGYKPQPLNEAEAIVYSELIDEGLTGMALSFGAGMVNVCLCSMGEAVLSFAISRSGDYIDEKTAVALDLTSSIVQAEKEAANDDGSAVLDLRATTYPSKIYEALSIHYRVLLEYVVEQLVYELEHSDKIPVFLDPVSIVVSGGTSIPRGFLELFKECLSKESDRFPFKVGSVKRCEDSLFTVARGALFAATL